MGRIIRSPVGVPSLNRARARPFWLRHDLPNHHVFMEARGDRGEGHLVVYFRDLQDLHLTKDIGQLPRWWARCGYGTATLVGPGVAISMDRQRDLPHQLPPSPKGFFDRMSVTWRALTQPRGATVLVVHLCPSTYFILAALRLRGGCQVMIKLDMNQVVASGLVRDQGSGWWRRPKSIIRRAALWMAHGCFVETRAVWRQLQGIPHLRHKVHVLSNAGFSVTALAGARTHRRRPVFVFAGRCGSPPKNAEALLAAIARLPSLGSWEVWFAGPCTAVFTAQVEELRVHRPDLAESIVLLGNLRPDALQSVLAQATYYLAPSFFEGSSLALLEAVGHGLIILGTDVGLLADMEDPELCSTLIPGVGDELVRGGQSGALRFPPPEVDVIAWMQQAGVQQRIVDGFHDFFQRIVHGEQLGRSWTRDEALAVTHEAVSHRLAQLVKSGGV